MKHFYNSYDDRTITKLIIFEEYVEGWIPVFINTRNPRREVSIFNFFAGSGTTAHAVLELYKEDGGNRKFLLIDQLDEYITICEENVVKVIQKENIKDDFVYLELMKWNQNFDEEIWSAKIKQELKIFGEQ